MASHHQTRSTAEPDKLDPLVADREAAKVLGSTKNSFKQSRYTGKLFGKPAPEFIKMGRSVRYKLSTLIKFRDQFPCYQNTSEIEDIPEGGSE